MIPCQQFQNNAIKKDAESILWSYSIVKLPEDKDGLVLPPKIINFLYEASSLKVKTRKDQSSVAVAIIKKHFLNQIKASEFKMLF